MALPSELATVTVSGTIAKPDGTPLTGSIVIRPEPAVLTSAEHGILIVEPVTAELDGAGSFTVELLATDDPAITPTGWTYRVQERWDGAQTRDYPILLPASSPVRDLFEISPTAPSEGEYVIVPGPEGPKGDKGDKGDPGDVSGLTAADVGADPAGAATTAVSDHVAATDPHGDRAYALAKTANLFDLPSLSQARSNLGLGDSATRSVGTANGTVAAGDDSRFTEALRADLPSEQGLLAWTYDPNMAGHVTAQSSGGVAGRVTLVRIMIRKQITWSNIWLGLAGLDAGATLSNCYLGVYDSSGNRGGVTADISTSLMSGATAKALPLVTPFTAAPGAYFIAMLLNGTWATNSLTFKASGAGISVNAGLAAPNLRYSNMLTAQTSLPATLALASQTTSIINTGWASQWYGVS